MYEELLKQLPTMDEQALRRWGDLHWCFVTGEPMTEEEQAEYKAGCDELDSTERIEGDIPRMLELQALIDEAEAENKRLRRRTREIRREIARAEARLDPRSRQLLGLKD